MESDSKEDLKHSKAMEDFLRVCELNKWRDWFLKYLDISDEKVIERFKDLDSSFFLSESPEELLIQCYTIEMEYLRKANDKVREIT